MSDVEMGSDSDSDSTASYAYDSGSDDDDAPDEAYTRMAAYERDVAEVNDAMDGCSAGLEVASMRDSVFVWLAIRPSRLAMPSEQLAALSMDDSSLSVAVRLKFSLLYTKCTGAPTVEAVVLTPEADLDHRLLDREEPFALEWLVKNRLATKYFGLGSNWPPELSPADDSFRLAKVFGCSVAMARAALEAAGGSVTAASEKLSAVPPLARSDSVKSEVGSVGAERGAAGGVGGAGAGAGAGAGGGSSSIPPSPPPLRRSRSVDERLYDAQLDRERPFRKHNILARTIHEVERILRNCLGHCLICDSVLEFAGRKPSVCGQQLCVHSYEAYGLGLSLATELIKNPELVDLYIVFLYAAANGGRIEMLFPRYVTAVPVVTAQTEGKTEETFMKPKTDEISVAKLVEVLELLPAVATLREWALLGGDTLKARLDSRHVLLEPLLKWTLTTSRAHIRKLSKTERIKGLDCHQFVLLSGPLEREHKFQVLKEEKRSLFRFHGSPLGNWHAIVRTGLRNMSNTKMMTTGAAYGKGIYFANNLSTSIGYMKAGTGKTWPLSMLGSRASCMTLAEIIADTSKWTHNSKDIVVVPQEEWVATRYLLVWGSNSRASPSGGVLAENLVLPS